MNLNQTTVSLLKITWSTIHETARLLENTAGNNGRALRRFLERQFNYGLKQQSVKYINLVLCMNDLFKADLLDEIGKIANELSAAIAPTLSDNPKLHFVGICRDEAYGLIQLTLHYDIDVKNASVKELRKACETIQSLHMLHEIYLGAVTADILNYGQSEEAGETQLPVDEASIAAAILQSASKGEKAI
jgi:methionine synthase II (cobalamin-independent)